MIAAPLPFALERLGIIMEPDPDDPREAWGVLNPGGIRGADGAYYLFPRLVAEGNYSRIGRARVLADETGAPRGVERLGVVLEPRESYEVTPYGGGVEDPRVAYLHPLGLYVMAYTAYAAYRPRIALAVSHDLVTWRRLGPLHFATYPGDYDLNACPNKDGLLFPDVVPDPDGRPSLALIHRPTLPAPPRATTAPLTACSPDGGAGAGAARDRLGAARGPAACARTAAGPRGSPGVRGHAGRAHRAGQPLSSAAASERRGHLRPVGARRSYQPRAGRH